MNKKILLIVSASFLGWSLSQASISIPSYNYTGGIYCYAPALGVDSGTGDQSITLTGNQSGFGSMGLSLQASSASDPTLIINNIINNTSPFPWTEYVVNVAMNQSFTIAAAGVVIPTGWSALVTGPSGPDINGIWTGTIDYTGGVPVALGGTFDFGYQLSFSGLTSYSLTESANPVPEPGSVGLLMAGGLLVGGWAMANRRQARVRVRA